MSTPSRFLTGLIAIVAAAIGVAAAPTLDTTIRNTTSNGTTQETGRVPDGTTGFDGDAAGVARLDPDLLAALRRATTEAAEDGVVLNLTSGWRSEGYQRQLLEKAVAQYGSEEEAARWVATPKTSPHVSGDAVDIGPTDAWSWLSQHGSDFGLCQIYGNEPWHYELRPRAVEGGCPATYDDPTQDPRMR